MAKASYSEDLNVQEPAAAILASELGWRSLHAMHEVYGAPDDPAATLGRRSAHEVVLVRELDKALERLNRGVPAARLHEARDRLLDADPTKSLLQHNEEKWRMLRNGITLEAPSGRAEDTLRIKVIDFSPGQEDENDFLLVRELWVKGGPYTKRCDMVGFVNGLPLLFVELKRHDKGLRAAFDDNYLDYRGSPDGSHPGTIAQLFHYNALVIVSNGLDARYGSITSGWDHFYRWKRLEEKGPDPAPKPNEAPIKPVLPILLRGMCAKANLLDIVENFILFDRSEGQPIKVIARNHQFLGVNRAIARLVDNGPEVQAGKLGVFWHTQGSGKSYSMVFFCQKIHRRVSARYTFVLLTDRRELDRQIFNTFVGCGVATGRGDKAAGAEGLQRLLQDENRRYVFSLIHKFHKRVKAPWTAREDIIVVSDEAHRTQNGDLATRMRMALASARFIGFTGTPLIDEHERSVTERTFGSYVSVYDFQRAVADGATLPLHYDSRGEKLRLTDPELNRRIEERIDKARADGELSEEQEAKLYRELARDYPIFTSDTHLDDVASDFVEHYHQRWREMERPPRNGEPLVYGGNAKAMLVCIDKLTCVKMTQRIRTKWAARIAELEAKLLDNRQPFLAKGKPFSEGLRRDAAQIEWMKATQIHPVFSAEQGEVEEFAKAGIEVKPFREVIAKGIDGRDVEECFKDDKHPFRVAIVCAMWLTGFDVKSLATLYLDKPMKGHTLMQAIARVNRVAAHKSNGLVIDYNGMLQSLRQALSVYGQRRPGEEGAAVDPLIDEAQALQEYAAAIDKVERHLESVGFALQTLVEAESGEPKWQALLAAQEALSVSAEVKKTFQVLAEDVVDRYRGLFPMVGLRAYEPQASAIAAIYNQLHKRGEKVDIHDIMQEVREMVDNALAVVDKPKAGEPSKKKPYVLDGLDFDLLRAEFAKSEQQQTIALTLQERIQERLAAMLRQNPARVDLYERYRKIIEAYNRDKDELEIQKVFEELVKLHDSLDYEADRFTREGFANEQELAVFDLLGKDKASLDADQVKQVKLVATELLAVVQRRHLELRTLRDRATEQARLKMEIVDRLVNDMPEEAYSLEELEARAEQVYQFLHRSPVGQVLH